MTMQRTLICFDYGKKRIGVAVGQEMTRTSSPLETLSSVAGTPDWSSISRILTQWRPDALVLGLPLNKDGTESAVTKLVKQFSSQLQERYNLPVYYMDERLSSVEAENQIEDQQAMGRKLKRHSRRDSNKAKAEIDKLAAKIILQSWLEQNSS